MGAKYVAVANASTVASAAADVVPNAPTDDAIERCVEVAARGNGARGDRDVKPAPL
jgi:hypothetical protein